MGEASSAGDYPHTAKQSSTNSGGGVQLHDDYHDSQSQMPNKQNSNTSSKTANSQQQVDHSKADIDADIIITAGRNNHLKGLKYSDIPLDGWRSVVLTLQVNLYFIFNALVGFAVHFIYLICAAVYKTVTYPARALFGWHPIYHAKTLSRSDEQPGDGSRQSPYQAIIIGSGFSGLAMSYRMKKEGMHNFLVLERRSDVAGTWNDNTYPGAACDIPSFLYSFSFQAWPYWSHLWSSQPQIKAYLQHTAQKHNLNQHIQFNTTVKGAEWHEQLQLWKVRAEGGKEWYTRVIINGQGFLSDPSIPKLKGLDNFKGKCFHSAKWDHSQTLEGKRVAVIGSGASAVQFVPQIQPKVKQLVCFIRTVAWVKPFPLGRNYAVPEWAKNVMVNSPQPLYGALRAMCYWMMEGFWLCFSPLRYGQTIFTKEALRHLYQSTKDPELRKKLTPTFELGCKRVMLSDKYIPALCASNTTVVTGGVKEVRENGVVDEQGKFHEVDVIVLATGFAVQRHEAKNALQITGVNGIKLNDVWKEQLIAYKGTTIAGFPNYFVCLGPSTNLGHQSVVFMAECQSMYILQALHAMKQQNISSVTIKQSVMQQSDDKVQNQLKSTVWNAGGCHSWYLDSKGRNAILWSLPTPFFFLQTQRFDAENYDIKHAKQASN